MHEDKKVSELSQDELETLIKDVREGLIAQGVKFKKTKYVRKKGPWKR